MSGQYPGHSRPPVGTPPPQTVWNHLTMTQAQGLNIHPTALTGAALNPGGFFSHPSMARTSHLNTVPQLAHTQAPATWHTPTVASKSVTGSNSPGNPLFSLQMLVDNRQNVQGQNQVQNQNQSSVVGSQNTLDLSATSDLVENYSRLPQENPISLTARHLDKGSRNGSIISPPIPLNGDTSSDSGISSSVPTPNSLIEPVSLTTKELPKISVKNFETSLKAVGNVHDLKKTESNFVQKLMTLPPSVTIERVSDKKEGVIAQNPRNLMTTIPPLIVNLVSKEKDVVDSAKKEGLEEQSARSPKSVLKRGRKGVDSLLEKLEGGSKKIGSDCVSLVVPEEREESVKSTSPERQKSRSPTREEEVISPSFSNEDSNDNSKQRRKRKLEKPVRLSKDAKAELEELEQTETRTSDLVSEESTDHLQIPNKAEERVVATEEAATTSSEPSEEAKKPETTNKKNKIDENEQVSRRRSSEGSSANPVLSSQRTRRKSEDDPVCASSPKETPESSQALNPFIEVESELEKMFAGIVETSTETKPPTELGQDTSAKEPLAMEEKPDVSLKMETENENSLQQSVGNLTDVSSSVDVKVTPKKGKKAKGRGIKRKLTKSTDNIFENDVPVKETKKKRTGKVLKKSESVKKAKKNPKIDGLREITYDSGSNASSIRFRGPVVHIEGPRDSPLSIQVVNAPREEEEEKSKEKRKNVGNGNAARSKRLSHQNDLDYKGKVSRAGLFSSTLSSRYDAHTTDSTWICVFCKQGPHSVIPGDPNRPHPNVTGPHIAPGTYTVPAGVLSDLFGPYVIGNERLEDGILSADEQEVMTEQKKGGKNKRSLRHAGLADQFTAKMGKKKKYLLENSTNTLHTGMTLIPGEEQRWEVWLHEQCAVWATGVYLAGGRVTGLQEAVWDAAKSICGSCEMPGANIGCIKRGCKAVTHYPCALTKGWLLDTSNYIPKCNLHRIT